MEVAATKIKADEAAAPRAAVRCLAGMRCHHFPEAEPALIAALRADRNEGVRFEAAQALANCGCCTPKTMEALILTASGSEPDGNAAETSDRVKLAANHALQRYASRGIAVPYPETLPPATQKATPRELQLTSYSLLSPAKPVASKPAALSPKTPTLTEAERRFVETAGLRNSARLPPSCSPPRTAPMPTYSRTGVPPCRRCDSRRSAPCRLRCKSGNSQYLRVSAAWEVCVCKTLRRMQSIQPAAGLLKP